MAASEALDSLDAVKCLDESRGDKPRKLILKELIQKKETLKLQNIRQSTIHMIFKKWSSIFVYDNSFFEKV